ncbi:hypothetical protein F4779DRAFT_400119 [Xylariaceae sp. FL0662B]|nr:hypothetical protein F4779DRAFT_400119 [Xylariaceae sp. FL0662B]
MVFELQTNNDGTINLSQSILGSEVSNDLRSPSSSSPHERSSSPTLSSQRGEDSRTSHIRPRRGLNASIHLVEDSIPATDGTTQPSTQPASGHPLTHSFPNSNDELIFDSDPPGLPSGWKEKQSASDIASVDGPHLISSSRDSGFEHMTSQRVVNDTDMQLGSGLESDFQPPQCDGQDSDSSYKPCSTRRRGKKAPKGPSLSSKAIARTSTKIASATGKGSKKLTVKKSQQQKTVPERVTRSKDIMPDANGSNSTAIVPMSSDSTSGQASHEARGDMKPDSSPLHTVTSNYQSHENMRQTKRKLPVKIPKESFFSKLKDWQLREDTVKAKRDADSQLNSNTQAVEQAEQELASASMIDTSGARKFKGYNKGKHLLPAETSSKAKRQRGNGIDKIGDDIPTDSLRKHDNTNRALASTSGVIGKEEPSERSHGPRASLVAAGDGDPWNLTGSPKRGQVTTKAKSQVLKTSPAAREAVAAGPNSKKKRGPAQYGSKTRKQKRDFHQFQREDAGDTVTTSAYGQNHEAVDQGDQLKTLSKRSTLKQPESTPINNSQASQVPVLVEEDISTQMVENEPGTTESPIESLRLIDKKTRPEIVISSDPRSESSVVESPNNMHSPTNSSELIGDTQSTSNEKPPTTDAILHNPGEGNGQAITPSAAAFSSPVGLDRSNKHQTELTNATSDTLTQTSVEQGHLDNHQEQAVQKKPRLIDCLEKAETRTNTNPSKRVYSVQPTGRIRPFHQDPSDGSEDSKNGGEIIYENRSFNAPISPEEDRESVPQEAAGYQQVEIPPKKLSRRSTINEVGDLVQSGADFLPAAVARNTATSSERFPLQELDQPANCEHRFKPFEKSQNISVHDIPSRFHEDTESEPMILKPSIRSENSYQEFQGHRPAKQIAINDAKVNQSIPSRAYQPVMSPSSDTGYYMKATENLLPQASQAPQLHPKSVSFALEIAKDEKEAERSQGLGREKPSEPQYRQLDKNVSSQHGITAWSRKGLGLTGPGAGYSAGPTKFSPKLVNDTSADVSFKASSRTTYEEKWRDAVDLACSSVVDALHQVSSSLLQHLRTREESLDCIIDEYKRNSAKIGAGLARRQEQERRDASKIYQHKCLQLANMYKELSSGSKIFHSDASAKDRNQAYTEWQRQTTHIKLAISTTKKEMTNA